LKQDFNKAIEDLSTEELQRIIDARNTLSSKQFLIIKRELKLRTTINSMVNNNQNIVYPKSPSQNIKKNK